MISTNKSTKQIGVPGGNVFNYKDVQGDVGDVLKTVLVSGSKNLLPCELEENDVTIKGLTLHQNDDGSILINGTYDFSVNSTVVILGKTKLQEGTYIFSGAPEWEESHGVALYIWNLDQNKAFASVYNGSTRSITITEPMNIDLRIYFVSERGLEVNNYTVYPMLRFASMSDEYVKHIKGFKELEDFNKNFIVPEAYGAVGDGVNDDTQYIQAAIDKNPNKTIIFTNKYLVTAPIVTSANNQEKVFLEFLEGAQLIAGTGFSGDAVVIIGQAGTRSSVHDTKFVTGINGATIDTSGLTDGIHVIRTQCPRLTNITIKNVVTNGMVIDMPDESRGVYSSDAYIENIFIIGVDSNNENSTGMIVNGHDNDIRNIRVHFTNIGINITGSHNRINNAHPVRGAADSELTAFNKSVAFCVGNNNIYLDNCYSDNFATGISVDQPGAIFFITNFTLLWWEAIDTVKSFIKLQDKGTTLAADKIFFGHVVGADLLFKSVGTNYGINGQFKNDTYFRNSSCLSYIYENGILDKSDKLFDTRLTSEKIIDFNYRSAQMLVNDLSEIAEGTTGRARFAAEVSPTNESAIFVFSCIGDSTRKYLTLVYPANGDVYTSFYNGVWSEWRINCLDYNNKQVTYNSLDDIMAGTSGRAKFAASISPLNESAIFIFNCVGDSTRKYLTLIFPSSGDVYTCYYNGAWSKWKLGCFNSGFKTPNSSDQITDLSTIKCGEIGRARFAADISPIGNVGIFIYECIGGDETRKILRAYDPASKKRYINSLGASGWTGWDELYEFKDNSVSLNKLDKKTRFLTAINLNGMTYSDYIQLPVKKSYLEAITYLSPYYYATCRDFTNNPNTNYVAIYNKSFVLQNYLYTDSTYGISNNIINDGEYLYIDFDNGYHVKYNTSLTVVNAVLNKGIRNFAFWNNKYYGIAIAADSVGISTYQSDLTTVINTCTVQTIRQTLQSASVVYGILIIPTTKGLFKFIDVETGEIIDEVRYYASEEIESFFEDYNGDIKCCGHFYGLDGVFNIGSFNNGVGGAKMEYHKVDASLGNFNLNNSSRYGFYQVTNGSEMNLPMNTCDYLNFENTRYAVSAAENSVYALVNGVWKLRSLYNPIDVMINVQGNYNMFIRLDVDGFVYAYTPVIVMNDSSLEIDIDLSDIFSKKGLADNLSKSFTETGCTAGKSLVTAGSDVYALTCVIQKTNLRLLCKNITKNSTEDIFAKFEFFRRIV